ncbi:cell wall-binding repeat-containing protein [Kytococcus sedentarius]|uniref:Cell wall-binding protein n=1 Tax=Kytococcus sedentarius (strain ATCC 14392 / DSM 20547 / JCM 11482 / CCUG 33030 / NBRC 15357 / NCTC 11040 / CCM 314 / 541) TaxID=478801 RepID=C7NHX8_KYTSD|nr:cell wall-binding repeat-containing protein [Kytococcus sedentarius]ACV06485.1 cell wall-binding protein [Kytococcus sedentarius DSM 20547]QQB64800.1 cell wall-binding repeat-containing protein [Kytococcus sedentarius]STX12091.1 N-acetylmuramoyl-L-alanine amidase LytC precursor [Kytococcus sedentarius]
MPPTPLQHRFAGPNRYETAVAVSRACFPTSPTVFLATGENFPDALAAGAVAGALGAPLLLTRARRLLDPVAAELVRLAPREVVVVGSGTAVSMLVADLVAHRTGAVVRRIGGSDRYATAAAVGDLLTTPQHEVFVVSGENFPDATAAAAAAAHRGASMVLTRHDRLPAASLEALVRRNPATVTVVGGTDVVGRAVTDAITRQVRPTTLRRVTGSNRYATAAAVARYVWPDGSPRALLATGENFPDALAAGPAAALVGAPVLLTRARWVPSQTTAALTTHGTREIGLVGGADVARAPA